LELFEAAGLVDVEAAVLGFSVVIGLFTDAV
jgi:hypothetical protein